MNCPARPAHPEAFGGWTAASKAGTSEEFRDNVVIGYTPGPDGIVVNVWMGNADNSAMANNAFSSAGAGPMWSAFMAQAHEYLEIPKNEFQMPDTLFTAKCGGRTELFVKNEAPTKPGACRAPATGSDDADKTPTPKVPKFEPRTIPTPVTPEPTPTLEPELTPTPEPTPTPTPESSPVPPLEETPVEGDAGGGGDT